MRNEPQAPNGAQQAHKTKKAASHEAKRPLNFNPGGDLRSRAVSSAVSSALRGLTSVFGMGTGVTLAVRPPETGNRNSRFKQSSFDEQLKEVGKPKFRFGSSAMQKELFRGMIASCTFVLPGLSHVGKVLWSSRTAD
jgi:hypothetical protein